MNNLCCREEGEKFQLFIDQAWQQHTILYQTLKKWFMDDLFLPFLFLITIMKMQLISFTAIWGRERVICTRKKD